MIRCLFLSILLPLLLLSVVSSNLILDGTPTWQTDNWYTQVDGVMGGLSSGQLNFIDDNSILSFSGTISLDGGGFSSVRRRQFPVVNLQQYSGIVVTLQSTSTTSLDNSDDVKVPLGLHLQFHDTKDSFGYATAFAIPITKTQNEEIQIYLPLSSFDRGTRIGFQCTNNCQIDWSIINGMDIYVLFQEGNFQVKVDSIVAVVEDVQSFDIPNITFDNVNQLGNVIEKTIKNGGGLYDYDYKEICIAVYKSTLNTIVGSSSNEDTTNEEEEVVSKKIKSIICQGLQRAEAQGNDKVNVAWTLRHTLDSVLEEIGRKAKVVDGSVWRPTDLIDDKYLRCNGVTSGSSGAYNIVSKSDSPTQMPSATSTKTETMKPTIISTPLLPSSTSPVTMPPTQTPQTTNRPSSSNPTIAGSTNDITTTSMPPTLVSLTTTYAPNPMLMISTSSSSTEVEIEGGAEVTPMLMENEVVDEDKAMLDMSASSSSMSKGSATVSVFFSTVLYASLYV